MARFGLCFSWAQWPDFKGETMMKYRENMTQEELEQFKKELQDLESAYASSAAHDAQAQDKNPFPDEWGDPSDYIGMGWIDSRGRP